MPRIIRNTPPARSNGKLASPLKWHGGKHYLAPKIVGMMPPHDHVHYVEPFSGSLAVLLAKNPEGISEVVNDLDEDLTNFWRVLQGGISFCLFKKRVEATPFSEIEWRDATNVLDQADSLTRAVRFFVRCRQSLAGRLEQFSPLSKRRTRRGMNEQASAWLTAIEGLPAVHARLKRVVILHKPAVQVIRQEDGPKTLFYLDPPYCPSTRTSPQVYGHEMTLEDHAELLAAIKECQGNVMLSGYANPDYDKALSDWNRHDFDLPNNAAGGASKRRMTETVWMNFSASQEPEPDLYHEYYD